MRQTILVCMALGVALAPSLAGQSQGVSIALSVECRRSELTQADAFRFTLTNHGAEHTNVVVGQTYSGGSWTPAVRLAVRGKTLKVTVSTDLVHWDRFEGQGAFQAVLMT